MAHTLIKLFLFQSCDKNRQLGATRGGLERWHGERVALRLGEGPRRPGKALLYQVSHLRTSRLRSFTVKAAATCFRLNFYPTSPNQLICLFSYSELVHEMA